MIIDILLAIILVMAVIKGIRQGLIVAVFSMLAFIIGLAAAIKLSAVVALYIGEQVSVSEKWLPIISFIVVFAAVIFLVRIAAKLIEKTIQVAMMGWLNRLGGIVFFAFIYIVIYSVLLFYASRLQLFKPETIAASESWPYIQPLGPRIINGLGSVVPLFKNMFGSLEVFFDNISGHVQKP